ncbi:MAG: hypothetical protein CVV57_06925 [Tenericutes bacterium HGW-Tenericutes-2]|jgi:hypothetical protein|nr:MAG: hypothetical protein CVV57_06925 [Tenericutes bacterium HGW-Tenericutes-2]
MNYKICTDFPNELLLKSGEPCVSMYLPTHRLIFNYKKDILVFKNLAKEAIASLEQTSSNRDIKPLIALFKNMEDDSDLWNYSLEGLAIFATLDEMILYRVEKEFQPISIVSNSFHIKPLVEHFQAIETFSILALEAESYALFIGNHHEIKPMVLKDEIETTLSGVLGSHHTEDYQTHGVYGGASDGSTFHGHGGRSDEVELDRAKFFKHVDRFVFEEISKALKLPMILVTRKEHHADFRKLSKNTFLIEDRIEGSFNDFKDEDIKLEIKKINDQRFSFLIDQAIENYGNLKAKEQSSDQLIEVLKGLLTSRVDTLFIEKDKIIPGKIDIESQQMVQSDLEDSQTDDILDDMIQHAYLIGSKIFILKKDKMPTTSGVAAIFRY